jgi:acetoin utilization protein AcuB
MLVGERMTRNPLTVREETSIDDALHLMRERKLRRLPVLDAGGRMVGIVSDKDLLHASPSPATSLSVYELHYLLSKLTVKSVMSSPVITVEPGTPLEEAARIMVDNRIGGLPVMEGGKLTGIITETDVFKILLELLGARESGLRVTLAVHEGKGVLARLTNAITEMGGNIISLVTFGGDREGERMITVKIGDCDAEAVRRMLEHEGIQIIDFRSV